MSASSNGFRPPALTFANGFQWMDTYDELLDQIAQTNRVDAEWTILRDMLKYKVDANIKSYLSLGPPWPLSPEEAYTAREGAVHALEAFDGPPFTIQRLCELALHPRTSYTSLPKYLRALTRVLSVSSTRAAFTEDGEEDSLAGGGGGAAGGGWGTVVPPPAAAAPGTAQGQGPPTPTRRPAVQHSPAGSPRALPVVVPLLSPIPWLVKSTTSASSDGEEEEEPSELDLSSPPRSGGSGSKSRRTSLPPLSSPPPHSVLPPGSSNTQTPTGGVVDEVDPGSGGSEVVDPVALSSTSESPPKPKREGEGEEGDEGQKTTTTLRERFVRASSPRVELGEGEDRSKDEGDSLDSIAPSGKGEDRMVE